MRLDNESKAYPADCVKEMEFFPFLSYSVWYQMLVWHNIGMHVPQCGVTLNLAQPISLQILGNGSLLSSHELLMNFFLLGSSSLDGTDHFRSSCHWSPGTHNDEWTISLLLLRIHRLVAYGEASVAPAGQTTPGLARSSTTFATAEVALCSQRWATAGGALSLQVGRGYRGYWPLPFPGCGDVGDQIYQIGLSVKPEWTPIHRYCRVASGSVLVLNISLPRTGSSEGM